MANKSTPRSSLTLDDLKPDPANRRLHTRRNLAMLTEGLRRVKPARSIVIDDEDTILAGNGVAEAARQVGITKVRVVDSDGDELIAVRRRGLSTEEKRLLAMYDNRPAELSAWDADQIGADMAAGLPLKPFFTEKELGRLVKTPAEAVVAEIATGPVSDHFWISIRGPLAQQAIALERLRQALADVPDVDVELGTTVTLEPWAPK
jgi:hypothetical protein